MAEVILKNFYKKLGGHQIIENLNLEIASGEFVTLLGPSGCGKTTLLRMIAGLESIDQGNLIIDGVRYNDIPAQNRRLAMVFQSYALFPHMTVLENIKFGLKINKATPAVIKEKTGWVISMLGLNSLENRLPRQISGGQRQRVALARALVLDPTVLLLDEPLSNLDAALRDMAMEELKRIHRQVGKTIIYVTHNQVEAMTMSGRIAVLRAGTVEQYDTPKTVYDKPATVFAAEFIGSPAMNFLDGTIGFQDSNAGISTPVGFLLLDRERAAAAGAMDGRKVSVGIRPQHVSFVNHRVSRRVSDSHVTIAVELIESMGDRSLVVGRAKNNSVLRFLVTRDEDFKADELLTVFIDGRNIHLFDPQTGRNIFK
jgi:multiple sugar transport system ATP-binding protein